MVKGKKKNLIGGRWDDQRQERGGQQPLKGEGGSLAKSAERGKKVRGYVSTICSTGGVKMPRNPLNGKEGGLPQERDLHQHDCAQFRLGIKEEKDQCVADSPLEGKP